MRQRANVFTAAVVLALWGAGASACNDGISVQSTAAPATPSLPPAPEATPGSAAPEAGPPASTEPNELATATDNGQTGSLESAECLIDSDCAPVLESWAAGDAEYELLDSACEHGGTLDLPFTGDVAPVCVCEVSVTRTRRDGLLESVSRQARPEYYFLGNDERRNVQSGPQCPVPGTVPGSCAYCAHEFPGCNVDADVDECAAPCAAVVERLRTAAQIAHEVEVRVARCERGFCQSAIRIDDTCYNQHHVRASCSLSDAEIIAARGEPPEPGEQCDRPAVPCASATDCPAGLACDGRVCGPCRGPEDGCSYDASGRCPEESFQCAAAEQCMAGLCVRSERADCLAGADCPSADPNRDRRVCLLSGMEYESGRGNEQTRSFCSGAAINPFGLRLGDVLEVQVVGPGAAVAASFEPPVYSAQQDGVGCGDAHPLLPGTALRLRVEQRSNLPGETSFTPWASVLEPLSPVAAMPPAAYPRDPAQGRQLWSKPSHPGNHDTIVQTRPEPIELAGCQGTYTLWLTSAIERMRPGMSARADGTFGTTLMYYDFQSDVDHEDSPACVALNYYCRELLQVEVTRLTP